MIFPEGTCTNRSGLILFKAGKCSVTWSPVWFSTRGGELQPWGLTVAALQNQCPAQRQDAEKLHSIILASRVCVCVCWTIVSGLLCLIPFLPVSNSVIPSKPCWSHPVVQCLNVCVFLCICPGWCATSPFCMCLLLLCLFTDSHSNSTTLHVRVHAVCVCVSECVVLNCPPVCYFTHSLLREMCRIETDVWRHLYILSFNIEMWNYLFYRNICTNCAIMDN